MRVFRTSYKARDGTTKEAARWYIELRDHLRTVRRFVGFTDKVQSRRLGEKIERLAVCRENREPLDRELSEWIAGIPEKLKLRFVAIGLLDSQRVASAKPLREHLDDFEKSLLAKDDSVQQARQVTARVRRIVRDCKFESWSDVQPGKVEAYLAQLRDRGQGVSAQTSNGYLQAVKQFGKWMVRESRAHESPIEHLKAVNVRTDRRHDRRALELDEVKRLLSVTAASGQQGMMDGPARYWLYRVGIETGLRAGELRSLRVSSFDLDNCSVCVAASYSKRRREDRVPLRPDTAAGLRSFFAGKEPSARGFDMPSKHRLVAMFRRDLEGAGIAYVDDAGRYADFHALRHTTGSFLAAAGVHPKVAMEILRHSKIDLTMGIYTHCLRGQQTEAIAKLPDLSIEVQEKIRTGTNDACVTTPERLGVALGVLGRTDTTIMDGYGQKAVAAVVDTQEQRSGMAGSETPFSGEKRRGRDSNPRSECKPAGRFSKPLP